MGGTPIFICHLFKNVIIISNIKDLKKNLGGEGGPHLALVLPL